MPLRNIDKYIKDKVQSYKPEYEEDLWKGIEKKLPAARVPNGRGSWMLTAAAVVAIAVLTPFVIKFYNLTGNTQQMAMKKGDSNSVQKTIPATANSSNAIASAPTSSPAIPEIEKRSNGNKVLTKTYHTNSNSGISHHISFVSKNTSKNSGNIKNAGHGVTIAEVTKPEAQQNGIKQIVQQDIMPNIFPVNRGELDAEPCISDVNNSRYPDHKSKHPIDQDNWYNWQSIFYPFWRNPACTGSEGIISVTADVKTDNLSEPVSQYTYYNFGVEGYIPSVGLGIGLFRLSELSPLSLQSTYGISLSKTVLRIGSTSIKLGIAGTQQNNNIFFNQLNYSDQINPQFGFINATSEKDIAGSTHVYGVNGGLWINSPHVMAGLDVTNYNQPKPGFGSDAVPLPREWRGTFGYRFAVTSDFQFMPMTIVTRENKITQANAMLTAVYKDKYMLSVAYQSIDPTSGWGNPYVYGAVEIVKKMRVFASYGTDIQLAQMGLNETFVHVGIKYQAIR